MVHSNFPGSVKLGVANGSRGYVFAWQFPEDTTYEDYKLFDESDAFVKKASKLVSVVYIRIPGLYKKLTAKALAKIRSILPAHFPDDIFPIVPMTISSQRLHLTTNLKVIVSIKQIPLNMSTSATLWKMQSLKIDHLLLDELRLGEFPYKPPPESLYVAVSRAISLKNLHLSKVLTNEDWQYFKPSPYVLKELLRLETVAEETLKRLKSYNMSLIH
jgi:hypothetical protein